MFQGYTLGNILSAQFFAAARARPSRDPATRSRRGEFGTLHGWLRENIYQHGAKFTAARARAARHRRSPMTIEPYMDYLWGKYQPLYDLERTPVSAPA